MTWDIDFLDSDEEVSEYEYINDSIASSCTWPFRRCRLGSPRRAIHSDSTTVGAVPEVEVDADSVVQSKSHHTADADHNLGNGSDEDLSVSERFFSPAVPQRVDSNDSVITVLRIDGTGVEWELDEAARVIWLQKDGILEPTERVGMDCATHQFPRCPSPRLD